MCVGGETSKGEDARKAVNSAFGAKGRDYQPTLRRSVSWTQVQENNHHHNKWGYVSFGRTKLFQAAGAEAGAASGLFLAE